MEGPFISRTIFMITIGGDASSPAYERDLVSINATRCRTPRLDHLLLMPHSQADISPSWETHPRNYGQCALSHPTRSKMHEGEWYRIRIIFRMSNWQVYISRSLRIPHSICPRHSSLYLSSPFRNLSILAISPWSITNSRKDDNQVS